MKNIKSYFYISSVAILFMGCAGGNNPGIEYAPDMYDSKGYEPYNQLDSNSLNYLGLNMRKPADGTIALGKADYKYSLPNTGEGYERSAREIVRPAGLIDANCDGKRLYNIYCSPCHGAEGKNDGQVFQRHSKLKPGAWSDGYQNEYIKTLPDGKIYHTLVYGKNNMGSHSSVLTPTERWHVIAYVRQLSNGFAECGEATMVENESTEEINSDSTTMEVEMTNSEKINQESSNTEE